MSTRSLLALLRRLRVHGVISLRHLVRTGTDERDLRTVVATGLATGTAAGLALTDEGQFYSFEDEPSLESLLDRYEHGPQDARIAHLQELLETPEPCSALSDNDEIPDNYPATERDWRHL